jgi:hypothetical protein
MVSGTSLQRDIPVIASVAKQSSIGHRTLLLDCFATLAMTARKVFPSRMIPLWINQRSTEIG